MTDSTPENPNVHYRESLTVWGQTMSAQVRDLATVALHHYDDAPRSTENGQPYLLTTLDAVLLRDVLNAATDRGFLPKAGGGDDCDCKVCTDFRAGIINPTAMCEYVDE